MAEQISHKKGFKRLDRNKRQLLKEYYQIKQNNGLRGADSKLSSSPSTEETENASDECVSINIGQSTLMELLKAHNVLMSREKAANNSIKSTIYGNYYDLVKVNYILGEMTGERIKSDIERLKESIEIIRSGSGG